MALKVGGRVRTNPPSTEVPGRSGVILEVLAEDPHARYRILWDDGHESIYSPEAGTLSAESAESERHQPSSS